MPRWRRPVGKHVPEVAVAAPAADLDALHAVRAITQRREVVGVERLVERRPARARLELRRRPEQRQPAQAAAVHTLVLVAQQAAAERRPRAASQAPPAPPGREGTRPALALPPPQPPPD